MRLYTYYIRENSLKKVTIGYDDNIPYYKRIIRHDKFDQPIILEEWTYNIDGTICYQKEAIPYYNCFGKLKLTYVPS